MLYKQKEEQQVELIEWILSERNLKAAIRSVKGNKGAAGIDEMTVEELDEYFQKHGEDIKAQIRGKKYKPQPVRRVYIPKANGKQRPLGIPTVVDRVIQQATAQVLSLGYERYFSQYSHGLYFDTVNHDKLVSILREHINDATTLHLIRAFLRAGVMENGLVSPSEKGVPQGGPLSPVLSNVYLDKLDKELEARGLHFVRYADDCNIFVRSELAADRVMKSVTSWLERKLRLKVSATKTKVVRPTKSTFLGFTFWKGTDGWKAKPANDRKKKLYDKTREILCRKRAVAKPIGVTFVRMNWLMRGWVNYFGFGSLKGFLKGYGQWMRHKVRVVILKQWKKPKTIYRNLRKLNRFGKCGFKEEDICKVANSRLGWYRRCAGDVANYALSPKILGLKTKDRPGLVDPLAYYLDRCT